MQLKSTVVFKANLEAKEKIVVNQGGTASSKTYSIMSLLLIRAIERKRTITVVGESIPNLKRGALRDTENIIASNPEFNDHIIFWNKSDRTILFKNGSKIEFTSYESFQSAKNGKRDILFVNEANGVSWEIFFELAMRTNEQIFIDYNPSAPFWAHEKLIGTTVDNNELHCSVKLLISDHRHNCFLSEEMHARIENIKDPHKWSVYARGKTGNLSGLIFPNWTRIEESQFPTECEFIFGIDYGYTNDPTAAVKIAWIGNNIYVKELCYKSGISPMEIKQILYAEGATKDTLVYSEHDRDMIAQLRRLQVLAVPANKGPNSIKAGISKINEFNVYYVGDNLHMEKTKYMWVIDKVTGKPTNTPTEDFNHLMDSVRYAVYSHFYRKPKE